MIPSDFVPAKVVIRSASLGADYLAPDSESAAYLTDYELGGVALNDSSQGLKVKTWTLTLDGDDVVVSAPDVAAAVLFTRADITELSLAFDQNMRPFVAFVQAGVAKYWWWDTSVPAQVFTDLPVGSINPRCCLDDKRQTETGASDIILAYVLNNTLYFRAQRDRFGVAYPLFSQLDARLEKVGMNATNRLQFQIAPLSSNPGDPGDGGDPGDPPTTGLYFAGAAPDGVEGSGYSYQYVITGGTAPYTVDWVGNAAGLSIDDTGLVTGTPTENGTFNITATVTDAVMDTADVVDAVVIAEPVAPTLSITGPAPDGIIGVPYEYQYSITGGYPPYTASATGVAAGLTLNVNAYLSGTPTTAETAAIAITVTDSHSQQATLNDSVDIVDPADLATAVETIFDTVDVGGWFDFSDSTTRWQNTGKTVQADGAGDPVAKVETRAGSLPDLRFFDTPFVSPAFVQGGVPFGSSVRMVSADTMSSFGVTSDQTMEGHILIAAAFTVIGSTGSAKTAADLFAGYEYTNSDTTGESSIVRFTTGAGGLDSVRFSRMVVSKDIDATADTTSSKVPVEYEHQLSDAPVQWTEKDVVLIASIDLTVDSSTSPITNIESIEVIRAGESRHVSTRSFSVETDARAVDDFLIDIPALWSIGLSSKAAFDFIVIERAVTSGEISSIRSYLLSRIGVVP